MKPVSCADSSGKDSLFPKMVKHSFLLRNLLGAVFGLNSVSSPECLKVNRSSSSLALIQNTLTT